MLKKIIYISFILIHFLLCKQVDGQLNICRIHYPGGGDWYSDKSSISNLIEFINKNTNIIVNPNEKIVKIGDSDFYKNFYFYITGHGNIKLSDKEIIILRNHLVNGAFLHVDDNYGLDNSFRKLLLELFPDKSLVELPAKHEIFSCFYNFPNGLPKIHKHDNKRPQALAIFDKGRIILLYTYQSDLGDGWENMNVHQNPEAVRLQALQMGTNIIIFALKQ